MPLLKSWNLFRQTPWLHVMTYPTSSMFWWLGDLLELRHELDGRSVRLIYLGPPSYIEREPGYFLILGVRPFGAPLLDEGLIGALEHEKYTRSIRLESSTADEMLQGGRPSTNRSQNLGNQSTSRDRR